jgi:hypothetical protein
MYCVYSIWVTDAPGGFADHHVAVLRKLLPTLPLADAGFQDRLIKAGFDPVLGLGPREAVRYIADEYARWEPIVKKLATEH